MKKLFLFVIAIFAVTVSFGQGINFVKTFDEAKAKAKAENKRIFVDFYTVW